jgi:hypothetical protein
MSYEDDLDEIAWQEYERLLLFRDNELCGYTPNEENSNQDDKNSSAGRDS